MYYCRPVGGLKAYLGLTQFGASFIKRNGILNKCRHSIKKNLIGKRYISNNVLLVRIAMVLLLICD